MVSRFRNHMTLGLALLGFAATLAHAASDVSAILTEQIEQHGLPGMTAVVIEGDQIAAVGAAGVRVLEKQTKENSSETEDDFAVRNELDINDPIHLGSNTKAMTATLCAQLVRDNRLRWNSTLGEVFPEMKPDMQPGYAQITLEQLLTHRSGIPANFPMDEIPEWQKYNDPLARQEGRVALLNETIRIPLQAQPGEQFIYSNLGYTIAGAMCERVTGKSWERLMRERIFEPLNMETAGFGPPKSDALKLWKRKPVPQGHDAQGRPAGFGRNADNPLVIGPAGTVHASMPDWSKFAIAHLDAGESYPRLVPTRFFEKLHTPAPGDPPKYACGWAVVDNMDWTQGPALYHVGSNTLWVAEIVIAPQRDAAILVATNMGGPEAETACHTAVDEIAKLMFE